MDVFFIEIQSEVDAAYRNYKGVAIVADVIACLVALSYSAYRIAVLKVAEVSRMGFAIKALQFAYSPIKSVVQNLSVGKASHVTVERDLTGMTNVAASVTNIVGNVVVPSYWAGVVANMGSGHWKTAFTRSPDVEIRTVQVQLRQQRVDALERMEVQINSIERQLGRTPTFYMCQR